MKVVTPAASMVVEWVVYSVANWVGEMDVKMAVAKAARKDGSSADEKADARAAH